MLNPAAAVGLEFLAGGGSMGERIRAFPWGDTALGEPDSWPQALRTSVRILLTTGLALAAFSLW